jgi:hypothetical protein
MARRRKTIYNRSRKGDKFSRSKYSGSSTTVTMGKMFRTRGGRYGCYVYINGRRSHFEEKSNGYYARKGESARDLIKRSRR